MNIENKVVVITGGTGGLGRQIALGLSEYAPKIVVAARDIDKMKMLTQEIQERGGEAYFHYVDVCNPASVCQLFSFVDSQVGEVDILINSAGIGSFGPFDQMSEAEIDLLLDTNLKGTIYCCQEAFRRMKIQKKGILVNVASSAGYEGRSNEVIYAATKFGVVGFTESLAVEALPYNIIVINISPGGMRTDFWKDKNLPKPININSFMDPKQVAKILIGAIVNSEGVAIQLVKISRRTDS